MRTMFFLLSVFFGFAHAQTDYPTKPIHFIVGPGPDALARLFGQKMSEAWGQPVIVDQRGGGGGTISAEAVAKAPPDGYWLLLTTGTHTINPSVYKTNYDLVKDFVPVTLLGSTPFVLAVHPSVPVKSVAELIKLAKAKPGTLNYGSGGSGTPPHLATELFKQMAGVQMVHVPYRGGAPAVADTVGGQTQLFFTAGTQSLEHVKAGKLRLLAVTEGKRSSLLPDVPTVGETVPGYEMSVWYGAFGPAGMPRNIVAKLNTEINRILFLPDVKNKMADIAVEVAKMTPEELGTLTKNDAEKWGKLIKELGVTAQ